MEENQGGHQDTPSSAIEAAHSPSRAQATSSPHPAWLTQIRRFSTEQLPRAPASFIYESIQPQPNQAATSLLASRSSLDSRILLNHHPAYTSSLSLNFEGVPQNRTPVSSEELNATALRNPNSALLQHQRHPSLFSAPSAISNAVSHNAGQPFPHDFTAPLEFPPELFTNLPVTHPQGWIPARATSAFTHNHVLHPNHDFHTNILQQQQSTFHVPRVPLAPQNIQYEEGGIPNSIQSQPVTADPMHAFPFAATHHQIVHPLPASRQFSDPDDRDQSVEEENTREADLNNEATRVESITNQKRKQTEDGENTRPYKRRTGKRGRPKGRKGVEGPRSVLDPGGEFSKLYNAAMDAFIEENDAAKAQVMILKAIGINPEIFAAHSLLADIYFSQNNHEAAIDALMVGLHAHSNDTELWRQVADTILNNHTEGYQKRVERAMYCYSGILRKTPKDLDARFQRAECAGVLGNWNKAFSDLNILLQDDPHNSTVLALFLRVCQGVGDISQAKVLYENHFEYYKTVDISEEDHFTWQDISNYMDILVQIGQTAQAITEFKRLARWLCGRQTETFWDDFVQDDREFDQMHYPRRLEVPQFEPGKFAEQEYGEAVPLDLRGKLGVLRLKLNFREEAQAHFDWLEPDLEGEDTLVHEYSDTFFDIAKGLLDVKEYKIALQFFDAIHKANIDLGFDFWLGMAACCFVCGRKDEAIQYYELTLDINPDAIEPRTQLAKLYHAKGDRTKALKYGREAVLMAQNAIPATMNRKYERKEQRLIREAATKALQMAYRMPLAPGKAPGKVPDDLRRNRNSRRFVKYVPRYTERPESPILSSSSSEEEIENEQEQEQHEMDNNNEKPAEADLGELNEESDKVDGEETNRKAKVSTRRKKASRRPKSPMRPKGPKASRPPKVPKIPRKPKASNLKRQPPSQEDILKHHSEMQQLYHTLLGHQDAMREGDEAATFTWMDCADALVRDFRTVKAFYPAERHKKFELLAKAPSVRPATATPAGTRVTTPVQSPANPQAHENIPSPTKSTTQEDLLYIGQGLQSEYCSIPFSAWLDIHLEYALLIANSMNRTSDTQKDCYDVLTATTDCAIFYHHAGSMVQIHMCWLVCALALGDDVTLFNHVLRWFMREYAFCTDTYRLYSAINFLNELPSHGSGKAGQLQSAEFKSSPNQKFIFRQIVSIDKLLPTDYNAGGAEGGVPAFMRRHREELRKLANHADLDGITIDDNNDENGHDEQSVERHEGHNSTVLNMGDSLPDHFSSLASPKPPRRNRLQNLVAVKVFRPKEMDVVLFILYSHILMASGSFTNALSYLYRAYCLDSINPVILLSMSFCYIHELFKRQNENRHLYVLYGWAWFGRYECARMAWAERYDTEREAAEHISPEQNQDNMVSTESEGFKNNVKMVDIIKKEIEFNKARCWEMLGMCDLAIRGYTKVLHSSVPGAEEVVVAEANRNESSNAEDWSMEAAYAMSTIYAINGNMDKAREITERYLVVE